MHRPTYGQCGPRHLVNSSLTIDIDKVRRDNPRSALVWQVGTGTSSIGRTANPAHYWLPKRTWVTKNLAVIATSVVPARTYHQCTGSRTILASSQIEHSAQHTAHPPTLTVGLQRLYCSFSRLILLAYSASKLRLHRHHHPAPLMFRATDCMRPNVQPSRIACVP
ncbi:hypothetical protein LZ32DRAFT_374194 [Colletotrichum eremochloae]|nr:hypothetical protein LZ32DRAFT_374194 [Colletotrichum eremochloae]